MFFILMKVINIDIFNKAILQLREEIAYYTQYFLSKLKNHPTKQETKQYIDEKTYFFDQEYIGVKFKKVSIPETSKYMINPTNNSDAYILLKPNSTFDNLYNKKDEYYLTIGRHKASRGFHPYNDKRKYITTYTRYDDECNYFYFHAWMLPDGKIFYTENDDLESETTVYYTNYVWENAADDSWLKTPGQAAEKPNQNKRYNTTTLENVMDEYNDEHSDQLLIENIKRMRKYDFQGLIDTETLGCRYTGNQPIYPVKLSDCLIYINDGRFLTWDEANDLGSVYKVDENGKEHRKKPITEFEWFIVVPWTAMQLMCREIDLTGWKYYIEHKDDLDYWDDIRGNNNPLGRPVQHNPFIISYKDSDVTFYVGCKYQIYLTNENDEICSNKINIKISSNLSNINYKEY